MQTRNSRVGLTLFSLYLLLYGGFVLLNAFSPETMEQTPLAGINLAIWYGFGLIVAALLMSLLYGLILGNHNSEQSPADAPRPSSQETEGQNK